MDCDAWQKFLNESNIDDLDTDALFNNDFNFDLAFQTTEVDPWLELNNKSCDQMGKLDAKTSVDSILSPPAYVRNFALEAIPSSECAPQLKLDRETSCKECKENEMKILIKQLQNE